MLASPDAAVPAEILHLVRGQAPRRLESLERLLKILMVRLVSDQRRLRPCKRGAVGAGHIVRRTMRFGDIAEVTQDGH